MHQVQKVHEVNEENRPDGVIFEEAKKIKKQADKLQKAKKAAAKVKKVEEENKLVISNLRKPASENPEEDAEVIEA